MRSEGPVCLTVRRHRHRDRTARLRSPRHRLGAPLSAVLLLVACSSGDEDGDDSGTEVVAEQVDATDLPILFASDRAGSYDLWLAKADGSDPTQLTSSDGFEGVGLWSPDGTQIAFAGSTTADAPGDVYVVNADGSALRRVTDTDDQEEQPSGWSPDGRRLLYTVPNADGEFGTIHVVNADGTEDGVLVEDEDAAYADWSPDGAAIVYAALDDERMIVIRMMDADGGNARTVSPASLLAATEPSWSPDGSRIAFFAAFGDPHSDDVRDWKYDVLVMDADGTGVRNVDDTEGNEHFPPAWSPDGRHLVYTADGLNLEGEIVSLDLSTGVRSAVTDNDDQDATVDWRPVP